MQHVLLIIVIVLPLILCEHVGTFRKIDASGLEPSKRHMHACEIINNKMLLYGGNISPQQYSSAVFNYDIEENTWHYMNSKVGYSPDKSIDVPEIRGQTMTTIGDYMYIFGGRVGKRGEQYSNRLYRYNPKTELFEPQRNKTDIVPEKRQGHSTVAFKNRYLIVYGGSKELTVHNDVWAYDIETGIWQMISNSTIRSEGHRAVIHGNTMYVFGGFGDNKFVSQVQALELDPDNLQNSKWKSLNVKDIERAYHTATLVGDRIYVIGGVEDTRTQLVNLSVFDIKTKDWVKDPQVDGPSFMKRQNHCAVADGNRILFFGGISGKEFLKDFMALEVSNNNTRDEL
jgi:N-acetylneuraminic acid mutarotase